MAYDKIITLRGRLDHCIDYVLNEDKISLANALAYTQNPAKTQHFVTGINCDPDTALADMNATKRRWDKKGGVLGYHIIHSYAPGEVTPEEAHSAGVELANRLLGDKYEVVVCTHLDREHLHCHIVFNSVSFVDGKKYRSDFKSYFHDLRDLSNKISAERGLSVIEPEGHGKHYTEWKAEKTGRDTARSLVRQDIDAAIAGSFTFDSFLAALRRKGYTVKCGPQVKHTAIRPPGGDVFFRLYKMGDGYTEDDIRARLAAARNGETPEAPDPAPPPFMLSIPKAHKQYTIRGGYIRGQPPRKMRGFRALYMRYMYLLSPPRNNRHTPPPFSVRKEVAKLQRYQQQFRFLMEYRIDTDRELSMLGDALQAEIDLLVDYRKELYQNKREGMDVEDEIAAINRKLRSKRFELNTCRKITEDIPRIQAREALAREQREQTTARKRTDEKSRKEHHGKWM